MDTNSSDLKVILSTASSGYQVLKELCDARRAQNGKYSLSWICKQSGIPTKNNISDACRLRRKLPPKYHRTLAAALGLEGNFEKFFCKILESDHLTDESKREELLADIEVLRKSLKISLLSGGLTIDLKACELFAGFGLAGDGTTYETLRNQFSDWNHKTFSRALSTLLVCGFVSTKGGKYSISSNHLVFCDGKNLENKSKSPPQFMQEGFEEGLSAFKQHFDTRDSHFESVTISVRMTKFRHWLKEFKDRLLVDQSEIESSNGDALIRFNVQCYPARIKK